MDRIEYLDGLKGIACFFIMLGHAFGIYKYSSDLSSIQNDFMDMITRFPFSFFTDENYWLCLFLVLSGYLIIVTMKEPLSIDKLIGKIIIRFIRLSVPVLFSSFIVLFLQITVGFHNFSLETIIHNSWFTSGYNIPLTFFDTIKEPIRVCFLGDSKFIPPYWCLREILIGNVLGYCINNYYLKCKEKQGKMRNFYLVEIMLLFILAILRKPLVMTVLVGVITAWEAEKVKEILKGRRFPTVLVVIGIMFPLLSFLFRINSVINGACFGVFLICLQFNNQIKKLFSNLLLKKVGEVSWGVFSYHWPVFSSIGVLIFIKCYKYLGNTAAFCFTFLICFAVIFLISLFDKKVFDPFLGNIYMLQGHVYLTTFLRIICDAIIFTFIIIISKILKIITVYIKCRKKAIKKKE